MTPSRKVEVPSANCEKPLKKEEESFFPIGRFRNHKKEDYDEEEEEEAWDLPWQLNALIIPTGMPFYNFSIKVFFQGFPFFPRTLCLEVNIFGFISYVIILARNFSYFQELFILFLRNFIIFVSSHRNHVFWKLLVLGNTDPSKKFLHSNN